MSAAEERFDAQVRLDKVRAAAKAGDHEMAHGLEDDLWAMTLQHIWLHSTDAATRELARTALITRDVKFHRWCA